MAINITIHLHVLKHNDNCRREEYLFGNNSPASLKEPPELPHIWRVHIFEEMIVVFMLAIVSIVPVSTNCHHLCQFSYIISYTCFTTLCKNFMQSPSLQVFPSTTTPGCLIGTVCQKHLTKEQIVIPIYPLAEIIIPLYFDSLIIFFCILN